MKPKIKEILFDAFAVACVLVGFSIHGRSSLCFLSIGSVGAAFALYFTLLNHRAHKISESQARGWALILFAISTLGGALYWRQFKESTNTELKSVVVAEPVYTNESSYFKEAMKEVLPTNVSGFVISQTNFIKTTNFFSETN